MQRACIAIVDAAHARIFTYDTDLPGAKLVEARDLASPGRQEHGRFTNDNVEHHRNGMATRQDNRAENIAMQDERFAKDIVAEIERVLHAEGLEHVILVAAPKMLSHLRNVGRNVLSRPPIVTDEIAQNLGWMTPPQLHDHLAAMSLIGPRERVLPEHTARTIR